MSFLGTDIKQAWNATENVQFYASNRQTYDSLYESEKAFITPELIAKSDSILDVGCAAGGFYQIFKSLNPNIHYSGIDISEECVQVAGEKFGSEHFHLYSGSGSFPKLHENAFDVVFCSGVMHLTPNWQNLLEECLFNAKSSVIVDFRFTKSQDYQGKYHFDAQNSIPYSVLNASRFKSLVDTLDIVESVEVFGYASSPNKNTSGLEDEIWMCFLKLSISPGSKKPIWVYSQQAVQRLFEADWN